MTCRSRVLVSFPLDSTEDNFGQVSRCGGYSELLVYNISPSDTLLSHPLSLKSPNVHSVSKDHLRPCQCQAHLNQRFRFSLVTDRSGPHIRASTALLLSECARVVHAKKKKKNQGPNLPYSRP